MTKFISFLVRPQDIEYITQNQYSPNTSSFNAAYYQVESSIFYWQHNAQIGNSTYEVISKSLDDLDKVLLLISLGLDTKELQEIIDGDLLDTF